MNHLYGKKGKPWIRILFVCVLFVCVSIFYIFSVSDVANSFFKQVMPGYQFQFPRDHFAHPEYQMEWWYYTGHLKAQGKKRFGYELTFFRVGIESQRQRNSQSLWVMKDVYFAHLAISDENNQKFYYWDKANRAGPGLAGAEEDRLLVWNGSWRLEGEGNTFRLRAKEAGFGFDLLLTPLKKPVIHGEDGVSRKSQTSSQASHYYSLTRIATEGYLWLEDKKIQVRGQSWMDREFFSYQPFKDLIGWDWFSIQLDNNIELIFYPIRLKDGTIDPASSGMIVYPNGDYIHL